MINGVEIIAEVKTMSPFGFTAQESWDSLFRLADRISDMIAIHTDPHWGGSFGLIAKARRLTEKPILAKGIHPQDHEVRNALQHGADFVLVVGRVPDIPLENILIEPLSLGELANLPQGCKVVWNSRDLSTGGLKKETFEQARRLWNGWLCQASNICSLKDIKDGADAVLVGSHLREFFDSSQQ